MPIESLLFADAAINLCIFLTVQAAFGCANIKGLSQALLLSMFNALVFHLINPPFWRTLPIQACFCFSYGAMLARHKSFKHTAAVSAAVLSVTSAAAGFAVLSDSARFPILTGLICTGFLLHRSRCACRRWNVEVIIEKNGVRESFESLIDTGNRLKEHRSGLPVLIVQQHTVPNFAQMLKEDSIDDIQTLSFGVLGSSGSIPCFLPDKVFIMMDNGQLFPAPPCWIAVFNGKIPGPAKALAPPDFAECFNEQDIAANLIRRFSYAFFNR